MKFGPRLRLLWLCRGLEAVGTIALGVWLLVYPLLWITRDGLGPDSVETTGWAALGKFSPMLLIGLALAGYVTVLHFCARRLATGRGGERA